jgi:hypothetical protein
MDPAGTLTRPVILFSGFSLRSLSHIPAGCGSDQEIVTPSSLPESENRRRIIDFPSLPVWTLGPIFSFSPELSQAAKRAADLQRTSLML